MALEFMSFPTNAKLQGYNEQKKQKSRATIKRQEIRAKNNFYQIVQ
jgi:hypothetical protein